MATSNTYSYDITASGLITDALRLIGVLEEGSTASADQLADSLPSLEMYVKSMSKYGLNLWTINNESESETLVNGTASYTTDNPALKILKITYRNSSLQDVPLTPLTRDEYWDLPNKDTSGEPTQFFFDPNSQTNSTIYLWPVPSSSEAGNTIQIVYQHYIQDITSASNNIDVPPEWLETIKYGLAVRLAPMNGYPTQERLLLIKEYTQMLKDSLNWDTEQESIYIQPSQN